MIRWEAILFCLSVSQVLAQQSTEDLFLQKASQALDIKSLPSISTSSLSFGPREELGRALFFEQQLSGTGKVACASCHSRALASVDGNKLAIGIGGEGAGVARQKSNPRETLILARNTLSLDERGDQTFDRLFWDGRVQHGLNGEYETPLGDKLPKGFV
ncbi:MAG: cytochrome c peroxidase [Flavobacteriales bacterium]